MLPSFDTDARFSAACPSSAFFFSGSVYPIISTTTDHNVNIVVRSVVACVRQRPNSVRDRHAILDHHDSALVGSGYIPIDLEQRNVPSLLGVAGDPAPGFCAAGYPEYATCAIASVAIVMATSMQNAENANLNFI